jgi:hypothetical protein
VPARKPNPLQWPPGFSRTAPEARRNPLFKATPYSAAIALIDELHRLGADQIVITSDLAASTLTGVPYADARATDPGVAVWFLLDGHERVLACDRWRTPGGNLRAIARTVEAIRGIERWGVAEALPRMFTGFAALPAGDPATPAKRPWREVLGGPWPAELGAADTLGLARSRFRAAIQRAHTDRGGDVDTAAALNVAWEDAQRELGDAALAEVDGSYDPDAAPQ